MKRLALLVLVVACFAVPATAAAQDPYTNVAGANEGNGGAPQAQTVAAANGDDGGSLPFTGLELGLMLGAGVLLLGTGVMLRQIRTQ